MRTVGIIAEYNPFHTGHAYHIRKAKELSGADYAVVAMSPDFVQRGEPAIFDKYARARMALLNGADLVVELPVCCATGSAETFALGGVSLLDRLGVVDVLCFGAETARPELFRKISGILAEEPKEFSELLRRLLRQGKSFPQARAAALAEYLRKSGTYENVEAGEGHHEKPEYLRTTSTYEDLSEHTHPEHFLASPNNILGVEYCKALCRLHSSIQPLPIERTGSQFGSLSLDGTYCSAAALRSVIREGKRQKKALSYIPENCQGLFLSVCQNIVTSEELLPFLVQKLLAYDSFDFISDISSDLSDRIRNLRCDCVGKSYEQIVALLKTRERTETHIRRALLHLVLDIREDDIQALRADDPASYVKILGLRRDASPLLHKIKENASLPILAKPAHASRMTGNPARRLWSLDLFASHLYRGIQAMRAHTEFRPEYRISPLIL